MSLISKSVNLIRIQAGKTCSSNENGFSDPSNRSMIEMIQNLFMLIFCTLCSYAKMYTKLHLIVLLNCYFPCYVASMQIPTHTHTHTHFTGSCSGGQVGLSLKGSMFRAAVCICTCMSHWMKTSAESSAPEVCSVLSKCNNTAVSRPLCLLLLHIYDSIKDGCTQLYFSSFISYVISYYALKILNLFYTYMDIP